MPTKINKAELAKAISGLLLILASLSQLYFGATILAGILLAASVPLLTRKTKPALATVITIALLVTLSRDTIFLAGFVGCLLIPIMTRRIGTVFGLLLLAGSLVTLAKGPVISAGVLFCFSVALLWSAWGENNQESIQ
jgi:hypothetical protein